MARRNDGSVAVISERDKLEFESVPEFVRETRPSSRDSYVSKCAYIEDDAPVLPKSAELEALWPGVNHDFLHTSKKGPSFYLTIGFVGGVLSSFVAVWAFSFFSHITASVGNGPKQILVAQGKQTSTSNIRSGISSETGSTTSGGTVVTMTGSEEPEVIVPLNSTYEVAAGDTLAAIALKNYKRATPRLLDAICKANDMRNANVLSLGQKLVLPEYRPLKQIATGANSVQQ